MNEVWQIAGGDPGRDYTKLFLEHDVMFMGPGDYGHYREDTYSRLVRDGQESSSRINMVRRFVSAPKPGDIVLLRRGKRVVAIGMVQEDYDWRPEFDDVYGWDLQHTRRVAWQDNLAGALEKIQSRKKLFWKRKQIPTFTAVRDTPVLKPVESLFSQCASRPLRPMPQVKLPEPLDMENLGQELFSKGMPNESVDKVLVAIRRQRRLVKWYQVHGTKSDRPAEHEVVAHMILPLFLALGWSEQLIAIEWKRIDLACFWQTPTTKERCVLVCEAKWLGHGLQNTFEQAKAYVEQLSLGNCRKLLVTDGARLYLYESTGRGWADAPVGYVNVNRIRTDHIAPSGTNAVDTIVSLTPARVARPLPSTP